MYIRDQPHAAHILLDNSIKHKKPQLSYLNRLRPLNEQQEQQQHQLLITSAVIPPTPEPPIVAKAENNPQKHALPLTSQDDDDDDDGDGDDDDDDDEGNEMEKSLSLVRHYPQNVSCYNYSSMDEHKFKRAKKVLEIIKKSERVKINKDNEEIYVDKVPTGLKASVFCMIYNNKLKNFTTLLLY